MPKTVNRSQEEAKVMVNEEDHAVSTKKGSKYSIGRITHFCKNGRFAERIGAGTPIYLSAVLEYLTSEIVMLASQEAKAEGKSRIKPRHIMLAIRKDPELSKYFNDGVFSEAGVLPAAPEKKPDKKKGKSVDDDMSD